MTTSATKPTLGDVFQESIEAVTMMTKKLLILTALTALFAATSAPAQTNDILGVPENELTVIVNAKDLARKRWIGRLLEPQGMDREMRFNGAGIGALIAKGNDGQPVIVKSLPD